jgi:hypothetical protein
MPQKATRRLQISTLGTRRFYSRFDLSVHHRTDGDKTFTKSWLSDRPTVRRCRGQTHQSEKLKFEMGKINKISRFGNSNSSKAAGNIIWS